MARRQVSIYINGREVENTIKGISAEKRKLNRELRNMVVGSKEYEAAVKDLRGVNNILTDHRKKLRGVDGAFNKLLKGGVAQFAAVAGGAFAVDTIVSYGRELFKLGAEMEQLGRKAEIVFAQALPQVTAAARENAAAMGLTVGEYVDAAAAAGDLLIPMGFTREEAAALSIDLIDLSGALAEWTGGQVSGTEATDILNKALLGEREELKRLGLAINEADVQARLAEKGLDQLTGQMLQQAKATATLELITERSADAQAAFADNSGNLVRKQAELNAKIQTLVERISTTLIPIFNRLLDVALDVSDLFGQIAISAEDLTQRFDDQALKVSNLESELPSLLSRYEELSSKTNLSKEEQEELGTTIQRIGELTPNAIEEIDKYGNVLKINADASRDFLEAEKARLQFVNQEAIAALEDQINSLENLRAVQKRVVETGRTGALGIQASPELIDQARQQVAEYTQEIIGAQAELARLTGSNLDQPEQQQNQQENQDEAPPTQEDLEKQKQRAQKLANQRQQQRDREAEEQTRQLERLQQIVEGFQQEAALAALEDDERQLERIRLRYEEQIELVKELERQGVEEATALRLELEQLRDEALNAQRLEFEQRDLENEFAALDAEAARVIAAEQELSDRLIAEVQDRNEREAEERRKAAEQREADRQAQLQAEIEAAQAVAAVTSTSANVISGALDLVASKNAENTRQQRTLTLIQIGLRTASSIASAIAGAIGQPFPANLVAIGTSIAAVTSAMAQARQVLEDTPRVPQRKKGGWLNAIGGDDGSNYRAEYLGQPPTGMLPNHPVLIDSATGQQVLGSERGAEYFVSNKSLQDPVILDHVRAIDNIQSRRPQYAEGGATAPLPSSNQSSATPDNEMTGEMMQLLAKLTTTLQQGIYARIDDDTIVDLRNRTSQLVNASGGVLS